MPGHISLYIDSVSPFSWLATHHLLSLRPTLLQHAITISLHPVYLGAIQVRSGNAPPLSVPAKARYSGIDIRRAAAHFGLGGRFAGTPDWFPMASLPVQRLLTAAKMDWEEERFEALFLRVFEAVWERGWNLGDAAVLAERLPGLLSGAGVEAGKVDGEARRLLEAIKDVKIKEELSRVTNEVLEYGGFGAPFFKVERWEEGREDVKEDQPFFGSDRFVYMFEFLRLPLQPLRILEKNEVNKARL